MCFISGTARPYDRQTGQTSGHTRQKAEYRLNTTQNVQVLNCLISTVLPL